MSAVAPRTEKDTSVDVRRDHSADKEVFTSVKAEDVGVGQADIDKVSGQTVRSPVGSPERPGSGGVQRAQRYCVRCGGRCGNRRWDMPAFGFRPGCGAMRRQYRRRAKYHRFTPRHSGDPKVSSISLAYQIGA
jgi:hypothetical protein